MTETNTALNNGPHVIIDENQLYQRIGEMINNISSAIGKDMTRLFQQQNEQIDQQMTSATERIVSMENSLIHKTTEAATTTVDRMLEELQRVEARTIKPFEKLSLETFEKIEQIQNTIKDGINDINNSFKNETAILNQNFDLLLNRTLNETEVGFISELRTAFIDSKLVDNEAIIMRAENILSQLSQLSKLAKSGVFGHGLILTGVDGEVSMASPMITVTKTIKVPLFDEPYYIKLYPDVANMKYNAMEGVLDPKLLPMDPYTHFINTGVHELRNPSIILDQKYYLAHNLDVANSGMNPYKHFYEYGLNEHRHSSPLLDNYHNNFKILHLDQALIRSAVAQHDCGIQQHGMKFCRSTINTRILPIKAVCLGVTFDVPESSPDVAFNQFFLELAGVTFNTYEASC